MDDIFVRVEDTYNNLIYVNVNQIAQFSPQGAFIELTSISTESSSRIYLSKDSVESFGQFLERRSVIL